MKTYVPVIGPDSTLKTVSSIAVHNIVYYDYIDVFLKIFIKGLIVCVK